uniref:Uncharacterized protein n=1 Tax=Arundo donax TaxID=35708 RepID=A0A0A8ZTX2_ARUDO
MVSFRMPALQLSMSNHPQ